MKAGVGRDAENALPARRTQGMEGGTLLTAPQATSWSEERLFWSTFGASAFGFYEQAVGLRTRVLLLHLNIQVFTFKQQQ